MAEEPGSAFEIGDSPAHRVDSSPLSVALLFYIVTLSAIAVACVRTLATSEYATWNATSFGAFLGGCIGLAGGVVAGFVFRSRALDFFLLPIVGSVLGVFAGLLLIVEHQHFGEILMLSMIGSWVLIVVMLLVARSQI